MWRRAASRVVNSLRGEWNWRTRLALWAPQRTWAKQIAAGEVIDAFIDQGYGNCNPPCFARLQTARVVGQQQPERGCNRCLGNRIAALDQGLAVDHGNQ